MNTQTQIITLFFISLSNLYGAQFSRSNTANPSKTAFSSSAIPAKPTNAFTKAIRYQQGNLFMIQAKDQIASPRKPLPDTLKLKMLLLPRKFNTQIINNFINTGPLVEQLANKTLSTSTITALVTNAIEKCNPKLSRNTQTTYQNYLTLQAAKRALIVRIVHARKSVK